MVVDNTEIFFRVCRKTTIDKEQDIAGIYFGKKYKDTLNPVFFDIFKKYKKNLESRYECIIGKDDFICFATQNKKKFIKEFGSVRSELASFLEHYLNDPEADCFEICFLKSYFDTKSKTGQKGNE